MTVARPHSDVVTDLRGVDPTGRSITALLDEAAALIESLVAERDVALAEVGRLEAEKQFPLVSLGVGADRLDVALTQVAAVRAALAQYEGDVANGRRRIDDAAFHCVSAVAKAVER